MKAPTPRRTVTFRLPPSVWRRLRALAEARAIERGGQASANQVIVDLIRKAA